VPINLFIFARIERDLFAIFEVSSSFSVKLHLLSTHARFLN
jgi:hypothetical protein